MRRSKLLDLHKGQVCSLTSSMQKVMWALQRTFAIVSSTVANPSPALARVLELTPADFISYATTGR